MDEGCVTKHITAVNAAETEGFFRGKELTLFLDRICVI